MAGRILIVEDDPIYRRAVIDVLGAGGRMGEASTAAEGFEKAVKEVPDLIIVDLGLPDYDGAELCRRLKGHESTAGVPILVLTGDSSEGRDVFCLDAGADSYLAKPVKGPRLRSYVGALLRRSLSGDGRFKAGRYLRAAGMEFRYRIKSVILGRKVISDLTPKEFTLLYSLALNHPEPLSRREIYRRAWGAEPPAEESLKTVEVHVFRIREKLGPQSRDKLATVPGRGYRLV